MSPDDWNFADDTTLYKCGSDLENLKMDANMAINWLNNNEVVENPKKISTFTLSQEKEYQKGNVFWW